MDHKLKTKHLFPLIKMVKKLDIKDDIKQFLGSIEGKTKDELQEMDKEKGFDLLYIFIEKLPQAEEEIYEFLSTYTEKKIGQIKELDVFELFELVKSAFKNEAFKSFFTQVMK